jgi:hypothetical protein
LTAKPSKRPAAWSETPEETQAIEQWNFKDQKAQSIILLSCSDAIQLRIEELETAKAMLDFIDHKYTESGILHKFDLHMKVINTRLSDSNYVQAYSEAFVNGILELERAGGMLADNTKLVLFMANLGNAYQAWQTNIRMQLRKSEALPSLDYLVKDLTDEAQ